MDIRRIILFSALAFIGYSLLTTWQIEHPKMLPPALIKSDTQLLPPASSSNVQMPAGPENASMPIKAEVQAKRLINVKTDVFDLKIDLNTGDIIHTDLLNYPVDEEHLSLPFPLLKEDTNGQYIAKSDLLQKESNQIKSLSFPFESEKETYELNPSQSKLTVVLTGHTAEGLEVKKIFSFVPGSYLIDVQYVVENKGSADWTGYFNTQLLRSSPTEDKSSPFHVGSYIGASYSHPGVHRYQKVTFKDMAKTNLDQTVENGWIAMQQRYFLTAWIPYAETKNRFYTRMNGEDYIIGSVGQALHVEPSKTATAGSKLYLGPEVAEKLNQIAPGLDLTIDYGWLWFISSMLFSLMKIINQYVGNWGWTIVIVTALIKLAFYRLSATSHRSMAAMRKLQPKMQALRERYGDDKAKMSQATMELYRQEKVNPLAGCLPLIVQIPVMIALYWVLAESVELRLAPFILWINDLSSSDPWHVLPILMGITMLIQQKLNPAPPDPMQAKVMMFLPVLFTALFWNFPAGLVLYWTVNNTLTVLQQWYITRKYNDEKPKKTWAHA